jgi:transmembrane sensor
MTQINPDLFRRYYEGKCSTEEKQQVEEWIRQEDNIYTDSDIESVNDVKLEGAIWQDLQNRIAQERGQHTRRGIVRFLKIAAAACIAALLLGGIYFVTANSRQAEQTQAVNLQTYTVPAGKRLQMTLPDSSIVYALGGTTIKYPEKFTSDTRDLILEKGEIFLDITHHPEQPFIVHSSGTRVKVLGTRFNVRNIMNDDHISVSLVKGSIQFTDANNNSRLLIPGQSLQYDKSLAQISGINTITEDQNVEEWTRGVLSFNNTPLQSVLKRLEEYYGVGFKFEKGVDPRLPITAKMDNLSLNEVLSMMRFSTGLKYIPTDSLILIK